MTMGRVVILDRDGVINEGSKNGIKSPEEWVPIPGSLEAITRLSQGGFRVVVVTDQSELGRERVDIETLTPYRIGVERPNRRSLSRHRRRRIATGDQMGLETPKRLTIDHLGGSQT